jgi:hypothetical protein
VVQRHLFFASLIMRGQVWREQQHGSTRHYRPG